MSEIRTRKYTLNIFENFYMIGNFSYRDFFTEGLTEKCDETQLFSLSKKKKTLCCIQLVFYQEI